MPVQLQGSLPMKPARTPSKHYFLFVASGQRGEEMSQSLISTDVFDTELMDSFAEV
jgi:hypothetical protein